MFGSSYYWGSIRKYIVCFGTLFNDVVIQRVNANGTPIQAIKVPIDYAPKDKMLERVKADPDLDRPTALLLPRMSFEHKNMQYDGDRKLNTVQRMVRLDEDDPNKFRYQYNPVPWNIDFSLYVYVKNAEDGTRIIEQILPYFTPEWAMSIQIIPEMDISLDVPLVLKNVSSEDTYEGDMVTRRAIVWTLDFVMKCMLYGPMRKQPVIKFSNNRFFLGNTSHPSDVVDVVTVTPGMFANGDPTTNAALSISPLLIFENDDWNYAVEKSGLVITFE